MKRKISIFVILAILIAGLTAVSVAAEELDVSGIVDKFSSETTKCQLSYNISGGTLTSQGKDGIYTNWHVINYYGTISPGETITISASALREKPKPVLPYTGYKPSTLRAAVTVKQDWWYADNQITAFAYMTFGSNFQGYPYGNQSDYIVRVIYDVV